MRSTIIQKKRKLDCGCFDYAFSKNRCKGHALEASTKRRLEAVESREIGESLANLVQDLDAVFSRFIRLMDSDQYGICACFTCGHRNHYSQMQCGHFIPRANMATRYLEQNNRVQCPTCNEVKDGNLEVYESKLGLLVADHLRETGRQVVKFTPDELKGLIQDYRFKVKILEKAKNQSK